ncbi:Nudix hydrolase 14, chloroplastic [Madurella mycetomatis]|uniref:Nudix hydrolase 14, chloroplastic n=1 Tax=Madurella mycetomatis TaxID=100816 RepID=A0A175VZ33_9PEZI|nr:Nudix hydrolase 14, chloroplastic [Madurella mycetomatis]KXX76747.1 Nudix hydrolase 14, chloroplastic [Madurella mycetomatis]
MSTTFQHPDYNISITLPAGLSQDKVLNFHPFTSWLSTLQTSLSLQSTNPSHPFNPSPYVLRSITVQSYDIFSSGDNQRLGFLKLTTSLSNAEGETLPGAVFLRGPSVAMLVMLIPDDIGPGDKDDDERYVVLTVQPRIAAGSLEFVELPAGMVDEAGDFVGQAAREFHEELGVEIPASELVCLSDLAVGEGGAGAGARGDGNLPNAVYPSPGGCDEYIPIYMHERKVPREQLGEWAGRLTGLREHGERITLKLAKMKDLWKEGARDAKSLAAVALWEGLRREGKI